MSTLPRPLHRAIICADVEGFGDPSRTSADQLAVRDGLYRALEKAFDGARVPWRDCYHEDRGDGVLILVAPEVPEGLLATRIPERLAAALRDHNRAHHPPAWIRLRLAVHAGEVCRDGHGVVGTALNQAFRLLDADPLRQALAGSRGVLAMISSQWFFEEVIWRTPGIAPDSYRPVRVSVKETDVTGWICLPDDPYPADHDAAQPTAPMAGVPRQLPAAIAGFTGRDAELRTLDDLVREPATAGTALIAAVSGTAGVGKTTLAVHWAHRMAGWFPAGELYVDLRGFDPAEPPVTPAAAIRGFLGALGEPPEQIPDSPAAQADRYRKLLAKRRVLVVLDNARDAEQVRPLLPGSACCAVVVTSRNQLTGLTVAEGARPLTLDLLTREEARQLLAARIGADRVAAEPRAVEEIITSCARLPLALAIVAARAAAHPRFLLEALASELRDTPCAGLAVFGTGDQATDVQAVFSWSYQQLGARAARMFRLLGLHPGPDITVPAAASLAGLARGEARSALAELARAHLVTEHAPGRFGFHDLLRAYAAGQAHLHDTQAERQAAAHRMLDHYLDAARAAAITLQPFSDPVPVPSPEPGVAPEPQPAGYAAARAWFHAEYPVLLAATQLAAATGWDARAWQLAWTLTEYLARQGQWQDLAATQHTALEAARKQAYRLGEALAHQGLGRAYPWLGRHAEASAHLQQAMSLFTRLGDPAGQAETHLILSWLLGSQNRPAQALHRAERALALYRDAGHRAGQANALNDIGWFHDVLGDHRQALDYCTQALDRQRELGDRRGQTYTLDSLGRAHHHLGRHQDAAACYQQALGLNEQLGDRQHHAAVLGRLGDTHYATGNQKAARAARRKARDILNQLAQIHIRNP
jgi:tetratricopeptide (TPR) repeat protein